MYFLYGAIFGAGTGLPDWILPATLPLCAFQLALRTASAAHVYGVRFALLVPLRSVGGNVLNGLATVAAIQQFLVAIATRESLKWRKTDHSYPSFRLGEWLVQRGCLTAEEVENAAREQPRGLRIGEYLVILHKLTEESLYQTLSLQSGIPFGLPASREIDPEAMHCLPSAILRQWNVLPYRLSAGQLHVLTSEVPSAEMTRDLGTQCRLEIRFRLVRPNELSNYWLAG
jgi:hypothetical protein